MIRNSQTPYVFQLEHSTSTPNERVWRTTPEYHAACSLLSFNHPSVVLTADVIHFFINDNLCKIWCTTQLAKLSFNHSHGRTHSWRKLWVRPIEYRWKKCCHCHLSLNTPRLLVTKYFVEEPTRLLTWQGGDQPIRSRPNLVGESGADFFFQTTFLALVVVPLLRKHRNTAKSPQKTHTVL